MVDRPKKGGELDNFGGELSLHTIFTIPWSYTLRVLSCSTIYLSAVEQSVGNGQFVYVLQLISKTYAARNCRDLNIGEGS